MTAADLARPVMPRAGLLNRHCEVLRAAEHGHETSARCGRRVSRTPLWLAILLISGEEAGALAAAAWGRPGGTLTGRSA